jgi:ABC-type sulfate transport system substrate-binding protein
MRRGFVSFDDAIAEDTTLLTNAFVENTSRCDVMVTYESNALAAASKNPELAVIYPNPTGVSEQVVAVVGGGWSSAGQKAGAQLFLKHLASPESLKDGVRSRFRPVSAAGAPTLDEQFAKYRTRGFQSTYATAEFPAYSAVNDAVYQSYTKAAE